MSPVQWLLSAVVAAVCAAISPFILRSWYSTRNASVETQQAMARAMRVLFLGYAAVASLAALASTLRF